MPDFGVTPIYVSEPLSEAGAQLNNAAQLITGELDRLRAQLQPLIDTWVAQSSSFYQEQMLKWDTAAIHLFGDQSEGGILGTIAGVMHVNWANYVDAEEANIKTWQARG